jgi:CRP-like cAMP-binding protein
VVRRVTGTAADLVFLDLPRRVAKLIVDEHRSSGSDVIDMPLTQSEIASRVGASRQSVNAALRDFQRRGWITSSGHEIRIRDIRALSRFVDVSAPLRQS